MYYESDPLIRSENKTKTKKIFQSEIESELQNTQLYHIFHALLVVSTSTL